MYKTPTKNHKRAHQSNYDLYSDIEKMKAAFTETASNVKDRAGEMFSESLHDLKIRSDDMQTDLTNYISEKPLKSLGITLLTGIVIGYFLHRK